MAALGRAVRGGAALAVAALPPGLKFPDGHANLLVAGQAARLGAFRAWLRHLDRVWDLGLGLPLALTTFAVTALWLRRGGRALGARIALQRRFQYKDRRNAPCCANGGI